jgi:NADPH:quinone reductase-like Zn-dependent oxidoreductase
VGGALSQIFRTMLLGPFTRGIKTGLLAAKPNVKDLEYLAELASRGRIRPVIDRRYTLGETAEAVRYLAEGHAHGKVIVTVIKEDS